MTRIRWTEDAIRDVQNIQDYIAEDRPDAALRIARRIIAAIRTLRTFPLRGRKGQLPDTRELVLTPLPYIVVFRMKDGNAVILRVYHGAQNRP